MNEREGRRRVYFALWPSDELREQIDSLTREWVDRSGGAAVHAQNFHVTLAFPGGVSEATLDRVRAVGAALRGSPFEFAFDTIESWSAARVLCLTASQPSTTLLSLASRLRFSLLAQQVDLGSQEFRPHVTLARRPSAPLDAMLAAAIEPVIWPVYDLVLVESRRLPQGSDYQIIERWPLNDETV